MVNKHHEEAVWVDEIGPDGKPHIVMRWVDVPEDEGQDPTSHTDTSAA